MLGHGYNLRSERNKRLIYQFERTEDSIRSDRMAVAPQSGTHAQRFRVIASLTGKPTCRSSRSAMVPECADTARGQVNSMTGAPCM